MLPFRLFKPQRLLYFLWKIADKDPVCIPSLFAPDSHLDSFVSNLHTNRASDIFLYYALYGNLCVDELDREPCSISTCLHFPADNICDCLCNCPGEILSWIRVSSDWRNIWKIQVIRPFAILLVKIDKNIKEWKWSVFFINFIYCAGKGGNEYLE